MSPVWLDSRVGSKELAPLFLPYGIQARLTELEFGDIAFEGNGPMGRCAVCIERKRIEELVAAIESRRLSGHQLPGMADQYDYVYLIVEGLWRPADNGLLQVGIGGFDGCSGVFGGRWLPARGGLLYRAVDNYLSTLELKAGVIFRRTLSPVETVAVVVDLWRWWQEKEWDQHVSHIAVYAPAGIGRGRPQLARRDVSLAEKWAMQLPGVDAKAREVAEHFGSAVVMAQASEGEWREIKGIGPVTAKKVVREINAEIPGFTSGHGG